MTSVTEDKVSLKGALPTDNTLKCQKADCHKLHVYQSANSENIGTQFRNHVQCIGIGTRISSQFNNVRFHLCDVNTSEVLAVNPAGSNAAA